MRRLSKQPVERDLYRAPVYRDSADLLKRQADLLTGVDRTLVMMYIQAGCSFYQLGRLTGMNRSSVARRIRRILRRLSDHTYLVCLENRSKFTDLELAVLRDHLVRGQSLARIAREHAVCYYRARVIVQKARAVVLAAEESEENLCEAAT
jgi:hypothetical protein